MTSTFTPCPFPNSLEAYLRTSHELYCMAIGSANLEFSSMALWLDLVCFISLDPQDSILGCWNILLPQQLEVAHWCSRRQLLSILTARPKGVRKRKEKEKEYMVSDWPHSVGIPSRQGAAGCCDRRYVISKNVYHGILIKKKKRLEKLPGDTNGVCSAAPEGSPRKC